MSAPKSVLHVLPHPGGGGETYVDSLADMPGYRAERFYLAPSPVPRDALRALAGTAFKVQWEARNHALVHVEGEVAGAICLPSLARFPSVVTLNGLHLVRRVDGWKRLVATTNLSLLLSAASRVICVSETERRDFLAAVGGRRPERVTLVRNGVVLGPLPNRNEQAGARESLGISDRVSVGAWVAGLDVHKDPITAVRAAIEVASRGTPFVLLLAGDGPLRSEIERLGRESGSNAIRVLGHCKNVQQMLAAADFFVLSSRREGLSFSLLEAMAAGLPAVVSDGAGNPDAVGDSGVIVPFGDVEGFARAFDRLATDEEARLRLGARARERAKDRFDVRDMVRRTRVVYDEVLGETGDR